MAGKTTKSKNKSAQTVRERSQIGSNEPKERRSKRTLRAASKPLASAGKGVKKASKAFSFLARPFKTRPARFVGRLISKVFFFNYFKSSWQELKQVTWPTRRETVKLTFAVFMFAIVFGLAVTAVDFGLDKIFRRILLS